ncbi:MAG: sugar nucleotide-binding protein [Anaerolineales bacterium]|nr:sugar nucleotide-binding protein [Anaerolineales bacterium]
MAQRVIITGASGGLGTALTHYLQAQNITVIPWDRRAVSLEEEKQMRVYLQKTAPDGVFHLATVSQPTGRENEGWVVNVEWTSTLARLTAEMGIRFVFTSSVMVFTDDAKGPFTLDTTPDAREGYGYEKWMGEERALAYPNTVVARIGWQIGNSPGTNNMLGFFYDQAKNGPIEASKRWYPACSFTVDTAAALFRLSQGAPGRYLLDSNEKWTFYEIASALNTVHGNQWQVVPNEAFVFDQRMIDPRAEMPSLSVRLPGLEA